MQSASDTPSSHSRRVGAQPKRGLWPLLVAERRPGAGRTGAQQVVALRESRRRGIDPPGITSADATLRTLRAVSAAGCGWLKHLANQVSR